MNETRVTNTIVDEGWIEGIKSIFYSQEKIRNLERKKIRNVTRDQKEAKGFHRNQAENIVEEAFADNRQSVVEASTDNIITKDNIELTRLVANHIQTVEDNSFELHLPVLNKQQEIKVFDKQLEDGDILKVDVYEIESAQKRMRTENDFLATVDHPPANVDDGKSNKDLLGCKCEDRNNIDNILVEPEENGCVIENRNSVEKTKVNGQNGRTFIQSTFFEGSNSIQKMLINPNFKTFSRNLILQQLLKHLKNDHNDTDYQKYFEYLCYLEAHPRYRKESEIKSNLIMALTNAWFLSKNPTSSQCETKDTFGSVVFEQARNISSDHESAETDKRLQIIDLLVNNVYDDLTYTKHLNDLYDFEEEIEKMGLKDNNYFF